MTERIHKNDAYRTTGMIEVLNEPQRTHDTLIPEFYASAYGKIRETEANLGIPKEKQLTIQYMAESWGAGNPRNFAPATFRSADDPADVKDGSTDASLWLTYLSGNHTGADVPVFGYGAGSDALEGEIDNTDLYDIVGRALRVTR